MSGEQVDRAREQAHLALDRRRVAQEVGLRISTKRHLVTNDRGKPLTQEALAHDMRLDRSYLGRVERGEVNLTVYNLVRIAAKLNVDPSVLVEGLLPEPYSPSGAASR